MTEKTAEKKQKRRFSFFPIFLLILFLGSLTACGILLYGEVNKEIGISNMEEDIKSFVKPQEPSVDPSEILPEEETYTFDWEGLMEESPYVVGWIQIPGIERINYPIVQHPEDNQFFLTHDWKGARQSAGAIFLNKYNVADFSDMNTVIYGHRMKAGSMFGMLKHYEDQTFMDEHPYCYIYTPNGQKLIYEVICCSYVTDGSDAYLMNFESPDERMAYYDLMLHPYSKQTGKGCITKRDVELDHFDSTIMLSTCNKSGSGYYDRTVILAKLVGVDINGQPEPIAEGE